MDGLLHLVARDLRHRVPGRKLEQRHFVAGEVGPEYLVALDLRPAPLQQPAGGMFKDRVSNGGQMSSAQSADEPSCRRMRSAVLVRGRRRLKAHVFGGS